VVGSVVGVLNASMMQNSEKVNHPEKTAACIVMSKIALPDSAHPIIISKNPRFWALHLAERNEFRFFFELILFFNF